MQGPKQSDYLDLLKPLHTFSSLPFWLEPVRKFLSFSLTHLCPTFVSSPNYADLYSAATSYWGQDLQKADFIMPQGQVHMPGEGGAHAICLLGLCCEPSVLSPPPAHFPQPSKAASPNPTA